MHTMSFQRTVIIIVLFAYANCQSRNDIDADAVKELIEKQVGKLDIPEINLNNTDLPDAEEIEKVLRAKCEKKGADNAVDSLKEESVIARTCLESYVNFTLIQDELDVAKKTGSMDEVFAKYCQKWPDIHKCFDNATYITRLCMEPHEEEAFNRTLNMLNDLQDFMCFKDGDRLAMFVAEGGVECVTERREGVQDCLNKTIGARLPNPEDLSLSTLPLVFFSDKDCEDFDDIRLCVNMELEQCRESTPANIVDAFFKFLKKQLPCKTPKVASELQLQADSSARTITSSLVLLIVSILYSRIY